MSKVCANALVMAVAVAIYRGAGFDVVWLQYVIVALFGALFIWLAVLRFRHVTAQPL